jgi:hypothetical protein
MIIMVDECWGNIPQKQDENEGGQENITTNNGRAIQWSGFKDSHFICIGFAAANGEPVICAIIISAQTPLKAMKISGYNAMVQIDDEEPIEWENIQDNFKRGANNKFPFGPNFTYKGNGVDCWVGYGEHGSIISELLTDMLPNRDSFKVFDQDRANGVHPVLLIDGRGSRFEVPFLRYTWSKRHK